MDSLITQQVNNMRIKGIVQKGETLRNKYMIWKENNITGPNFLLGHTQNKSIIRKLKEKCMLYTVTFFCLVFR